MLPLLLGAAAILLRWRARTSRTSCSRAARRAAGSSRCGRRLARAASGWSGRCSLKASCSRPREGRWASSWRAGRWTSIASASAEGHRARRSHSDRQPRRRDRVRRDDRRRLVAGLDAVHSALTAGRRHGPQRKGAAVRAEACAALLVVVEVAAALVLAVGAGLLVRSFVFDPARRSGLQPRRRDRCFRSSRHGASTHPQKRIVFFRAGARAHARPARRRGRRRRDIDAVWRGARRQSAADRDRRPPARVRRRRDWCTPRRLAGDYFQCDGRAAPRGPPLRRQPTPAGSRQVVAGFPPRRAAVLGRVRSCWIERCDSSSRERSTTPRWSAWWATCVMRRWMPTAAAEVVSPLFAIGVLRVDARGSHGARIARESAGPQGADLGARSPAVDLRHGQAGPADIEDAEEPALQPLRARRLRARDAATRDGRSVRRDELFNQPAHAGIRRPAGTRRGTPGYREAGAS